MSGSHLHILPRVWTTERGGAAFTTAVSHYIVHVFCQSYRRSQGHLLRLRQEVKLTVKTRVSVIEVTTDKLQMLAPEKPGIDSQVVE